MNRIFTLAGCLLASFAMAGLGTATTVNCVREWYPAIARCDFCYRG